MLTSVIRRTTVAALISATVFIVPVTFAHADGALMASIADGKAWAMSASNGRNGKLTLMPDGSGKVGMGPFSMAATWKPIKGGFCLNTKRMGERCMQLSKTEFGYAGKGADGATIALKR